MTKAVLEFINNKLTSQSINYEFGKWNSDIVYPYFVGEYFETNFDSECGLHEYDFELQGFSRRGVDSAVGAWEALENAREVIESLFTDCTEILKNGSGIDISYSGSLPIPTGDSELERMQINLKIKEWKVNA